MSFIMRSTTAAIGVPWRARDYDDTLLFVILDRADRRKCDRCRFACPAECLPVHALAEIIDQAIGRMLDDGDRPVEQCAASWSVRIPLTNSHASRGVRGPASVLIAALHPGPLHAFS
jgi:hypothetical protein